MNRIDSGISFDGTSSPQYKTPLPFYTMGTTLAFLRLGATVEGPLGLGSGALIGDQVQALQQRQMELEKQLNRRKPNRKIHL
jgi:hypothetical protein